MRITVFQQDTGQGSCGQEQDIITAAEETGEAGHQHIIRRMDLMDVLIFRSLLRQSFINMRNREIRL